MPAIFSKSTLEAVIEDGGLKLCNLFLFDKLAKNS